MITVGDREAALGVKCFMCGAAPGERCRTGSDGFAGRPHIWRINDGRRLAQPPPALDEPVS